MVKSVKFRVFVRAESWPNQSLEPTRVGKPPLAAQLQRCTAGLGKAK